MAAMTTVLTPYSEKGHESAYEVPGHTVLKPKLVLQRRRPAVGENGVAEDVVSILQGTEDADGNNLASKILFTVTVRRPIQGQSTDIAAAETLFREFIASDEFDAVVDSQSRIA